MPDTQSHKICSKCNLPKPRTRFYPEPRVSDGLTAECADCKAEYRKKYRSTQHGKNYNSQWSRSYYHRRENRSKVIARDTIHKAVYRKKLTKPNSCSQCGKTNTRIEAHHHNGYSYDNRFDVVWLCSMCHNRIETRAKSF